jgi:hypothetical protein
MMQELPRYSDGQEIRVGDKVVRPHSGEQPRTITNIFPPDHEVSRLYEMEFGCVELESPSAILPIPIEEDIELIERSL